MLPDDPPEPRSPNEDDSELLPTRRKITFSGPDLEGIFLREVRGIEATGVLSGDRTAPSCNIIESVLHDLTADSVEFRRCDFKDNAIRTCRFKDCNFGSSSIAYNAIMSSQFENCSFPDTDIHNCDFFDTLFVQCDLRNALIKSCSFTRCEFRECATNNQVFETSRFADCEFRATELQIQSIEDNFGIIASHYKALLRDDRGDAAHRKYKASDIEPRLQIEGLHPLKKLSIEYFLNGTLVSGSDNLDAALAFESWESLSRNPGSFAVTLSQWVEFMLWLYDHDELLAHTLVGLHSLTSQLSEALYKQASHYEALAMFSGALALIDGAHSSITRSLESFLETVDLLAGTIESKIAVLVQPGGSKEHYQRELSLLIERADGHIVELKPYNSPWLLAILLGPHANALHVAALFLASRVRLEIYHVFKPLKSRGTPSFPFTKDEATLAKREQSLAVQPIDGLTRIFAVDAPKLELMAYLPGVRLLIFLKLNISSRKVADLRKSLIRWLTSLDDDASDVNDAS